MLSALSGVATIEAYLDSLTSLQRTHSRQALRPVLLDRTFDSLQRYHREIHDYPDGPRSSVQLSAELSWNLLESQVINQPALRLCPGILVGLGILGTFVGLTMGIASFDAANPEAGMLLEGMQVAFITSIVGIASSLLFQSVAGFALRQSEKMHAQLLNELDHRFPWISAEELTQQAYADQDAQLEALRSRIDRMATELPQQLLIAHTLSRTQQHREFRELHASLLEITDSLDHVQVELAAQARGLAQQIDASLERRVEASFTSFMNDFRDQQAQGFKEIASTLREQVHEITAREFAALREVLAQIIQLHEVEAEARQRGIDSLQQATRSGELLLAALEESSRYLQEYAGSLRQLQDQLLGEVRGQGEAQRLQLELLQALRGDLSDFREAQHYAIETLRAALQETLAAASSYITEALQKQQQQMELMLAQYTSRESEFAQAIEQALTRLEEAVDTAVAGIQASGAAMADDIRASIREELLTTMQQVMESLELGRSTLSLHLDEIRDQTENMTDTLEALLQGMKRQQVDTQKELTALAQTITGSEKALQKMSDQISNASVGLAEQTTGHLESFRVTVDRLLGEATSHLSGSVNEIKDATEVLPGTINRLNVELRQLAEVLRNLRQGPTGETGSAR